MRTLLIGADGQLGHELRGRLSGRGYEVVATTLSGKLATGEDCVALDLSHAAALREIVRGSGADLVMNAAAYTAVDRAETESELAFAINATAPRIMAEECAARRIPLVHFSTDYVFGGEGTRPLREDDPIDPKSIYGVSKLQGEQAVRESCPSHRIFRLCWVYGPRGQNFLLTMLRLGKQGKPLRVVADQVGSPTPAGWIADAVVQALVAKPESSGTWHLAASGQTSWHGFAREIFERSVALGLLDRLPELSAITTDEYPTPARRPAYSVLDCSKLEADFGIEPPSWQDGAGYVLQQLLREEAGAGG